MRTVSAFFVGLSSVIGLAGLAAWTTQETGARAHDTTKPADFRARAESFVASLSDGERDRCVRPLDAAERTNWYFARGDRAGLFLRDMDAHTREATLALVDAFLSVAGREQWRLIRVVEAINGRNEKAAGIAPPTYGDDLYAVHFFGAPSDRAWAFEIEGHHFVLHAAVIDGVATVTPIFTGSFPAEIGEGAEKGKRPLGAPVAVAFELARSLEDAQRVKARIMDKPPADVLWAVGADAKAPEPRGIARGEMNDAQKALVDRLLAEHAGLLDARVAAAQLRAWHAAPEQDRELTFAFVGEPDLHKPHYYRLATKFFTIEYDSTNADASHVHCVWSDPATNFGGEALRAHLKAEHGAQSVRTP